MDQNEAGIGKRGFLALDEIVFPFMTIYHTHGHLKCGDGFFCQTISMKVIVGHDIIKRNCFVLRIRLRFKPRKFSACVSLHVLVASYYDISREGQKIGSVVDR